MTTPIKKGNGDNTGVLLSPDITDYAITIGNGDLLNVLDAVANAGAAFRSLADPIEAE